ncbi:MAG: serine hydrolase [Firmicutes bacterium ZCTH02-B6]|nr:MAG: serine hydrolase [Firmicutes bacterium ZCTH02-B6]
MATLAACLVAAALALTLAAGPVGVSNALAQANISPAAALERLLVSDNLEAEWFAPVFLNQISVEQVALIIAQLTAGLGQFVGVEGAGMNYELVFEQGVVLAQIVLDAEGRIAGLFFGPPRPKVSGLEEALAPFAELPGQVSVLVLGGAAELAALNPDQPLAVGSAFKLAVLAALRQQVAVGERSWDDVVVLDEAWRSLPSGILQEWPGGAPLTLHTLAALMISVSDNTATDALLSLVGRDAVEAFTVRNRPFLSTREAFVLKNPANEELLARWRTADEAGRRALLDEAAGWPLPAADVFNAPRALDVEWYFTTRELCGLMGAVYDLPLMTINPGVANADDWAWVAFKGGSEPGVLNLTTALVDANGAGYCVSATWNHAENLDELRFLSLYSGLLEAIKQLGAAR